MIVPIEIVCLIAEFVPTAVVLYLSKTIYSIIAEPRLRKCFAQKYPIYCSICDIRKLSIEEINRHGRRYPNVFVKDPQFMTVSRPFHSDTKISLNPCYGWNRTKTSITCFDNPEFYFNVTGILNDNSFYITVNSAKDPKKFGFVNIGKIKLKGSKYRAVCVKVSINATIGGISSQISVGSNAPKVNFMKTRSSDGLIYVSSNRDTPYGYVLNLISKQEYLEITRKSEGNAVFRCQLL